MNIAKQLLGIAVFTSLLLFSAACGRSDSISDQAMLSSTPISTLADTPPKSLNTTPFTPPLTHTPLPQSISAPTLSSTITDRILIDNGAGGELLERPQLPSGLLALNGWFFRREGLLYSVYAGYRYDQIKGGGPREGFILKRITDVSGDDQRRISSHYDYVPKEEGTLRIVTAHMTDTSMQVIIKTDTGIFYRYDVLEETLKVVAPADLTITPLPVATGASVPKATASPLPSSQPTPLAGGASGWMIEHPWIHPRYTLTNAWRMTFESFTDTFYAGFEHVQSTSAQPEPGVLIVRRSAERDGQEQIFSSEVYHLPRGTGAARISNVTSDGTHYQLTIQTDAGRTFLFDGGIDGPKEIQP